MCGINGFVENNKSNPLDKLSEMNNLIIHRGPDSNGVYVDFNKYYNIAMGMRRLSIIDINGGNQPFFSDDKNVVIVFNGEIYNYQSIKMDLINKGCKFKSNSDTEVILKLYEFEGPKSFGKLDGMFVFSIYDKTIDTIYIARDFFGEKPLYYTKTQSSFVWASELKSIIYFLGSPPDISKLGLSLYFQLTYIPSPYTIYDNIFKLEPNHYIEYNCKLKSISIHEIPQDYENLEIKSKKDSINQTRKLVSESVQSRSISDVKVGTFLSGGVDSSIVSLCLAQQTSSKIDTFSIGFQKKAFDETDKARLVSKIINSNHHEFIISENELSYNINDVLLNFDEPFADSSALASYLLSKNTKEFLKVALTGDGGDEVFGGYNKYYIGKINKKYTSLVPQNLHNLLRKISENLINDHEDKRDFKFKFNKLINAIDYNNNFYANIISLGFLNSDLKYLLKNIDDITDPLTFWSNNLSLITIKDFRNFDRFLSLEGDMLVKIDRTSMLASLECRSPFLNKNLWNFTNHLPDSYLVNGWDKKHILKEAFKEYFPKEFLNKSKMGFGVPVGDWLSSGLKQELISYFDKNFIKKQNIFNYDFISKIISDHINGKKDNTFKVWTFYCFQKWYTQIYNVTV